MKRARTTWTLMGMVLLVVMLCCLVTSNMAWAGTLVTIQQTAGFSGSGTGHNEAGDAFDCNIITWPDRGRVDAAWAWLYFGRLSASDHLIINGMGTVPAAMVSASAEFVIADIPDVSAIPDFTLSCYDMSILGAMQSVACPSPVALHIKVKATRTSLTEMRGVTREVTSFPDGSIWTTTRNGQSTNVAAIVTGNMAGLELPIANALFNRGAVLIDRGVTITVERTP
jgi:hypothetical protein